MVARAVQTVRSALGRLAGEGPLGIACSGGGDSLALLVIASDWARANGRSLQVLTVDHGLRKSSADEANHVAAMADRLGWPCTCLTWDDARPGAGLQARARDARHRLLARACRDLGLTELALAHTRDDQSETVWLRLAAGGSWRSAAVMSDWAPSPVWPDGRDLDLLRPCLDVTRAELRRVLSDAGIDWVDDPSNEDDRYARVRARGDLGLLSEAGFQPDRFAELGALLRPVHAAERRAAWHCGQAALVVHAWGGVSIDRAAWSRIVPAVRLTLLDALVMAVSGQSESPSRGRLVPLDAAILASTSVTGCGVQVLAGTAGTVWLIRDRGAVLGRVDHDGIDPWTDQSDVCRVFDGRFEIATSARKLEWAVLGETYDGLTSRAILDAVPGAARAGLLVAREAGQVVVLAGLGPVADSLTAEAAHARSLVAHRFCRRLLPQPAVRWFDEPEMA